MAPHSSTLAWKIPWTGEPGRLQPMGSLRVRHDWATSRSLSLSCIGEGNGNLLHCSCLENPRDGEPGGLHDWSDLAAAAGSWFFTTEPPGKPSDSINLVCSHFLSYSFLLSSSPSSLEPLMIWQMSLGKISKKLKFISLCFLILIGQQNLIPLKVHQDVPFYSIGVVVV